MDWYIIFLNLSFLWSYQNGVRLKNYRGMGSLEAMAKGSDARYLGDKSRLKIAQGVSGSVAAKGSVLRLVPYTMQAVKQGLQDLGVASIHAAHDALKSGTIRLEVHISSPCSLLNVLRKFNSRCLCSSFDKLINLKLFSLRLSLLYLELLFSKCG